MAQNKFMSIFLRILLIFALLTWFYPQPTSAAGPLTALSDTMSRLQKSTVKSDHTIKYTTPTGVAAGQNMQITMPTGFAIGSVDDTDIDVSWGASYENELTLAATCSGSTWGAAFTGQVLAITSCTGTITGTSKVMIEIGLNATDGDQQITNHATAATYTISIGGTFTDTGKIAIVILENDQFTVSATVDPTITLGLSATSTDFGTLGTSVKTSDPIITLTVSTNANSGYSITVQDEGNGSNGGLYKTVGGAYTIGSADYLYNDSANLSDVAGYGIQGASGTATIIAPYNGSVNNVGGYKRTAQSFATWNGTADGQTITITSKAKVTGNTPAGTYGDTVTVIATGNF